MLPSRSIRIGTRKPNASMLAAICLPDLLLAVPARIGGVGLYLVDTPMDQLQQLGASGARRRSGVT
jgi:hypothetical protein